MTNLRIGSGYDVHQLSENRKLILGGVEIPFEKGLLGHSDADVLLHAIADALLGALALGDIGLHFPDSEKAYKDMDSKVLLSKVYELVLDYEYKLVNLDATIVMQRPKLRPYINKMRKNISAILDSAIENISVKATTSERLGFVGKEEGVESFATVLLKKDKQ
jgi:2-C-methyl-D-erythritol 2,4-cyclodiphosphate synthase